jgi:hypothetical protein
VFTGIPGSGEGRGGDVAVGGNSEADGLGPAGGGGVNLGDFVVGGVEADLESLGFAGPAFAFGLGDAGLEVVADLFEAVALAGSVRAWASDAGVLVDAAGGVGASDLEGVMSPSWLADLRLSVHMEGQALVTLITGEEKGPSDGPSDIQQTLF